MARPWEKSKIENIRTLAKTMHYSEIAKLYGISPEGMRVSMRKYKIKNNACPPVIEKTGKIKRTKRNGVWYYHLQVPGKYDGSYTVTELANLPECVVSRELLAQRLAVATRNAGGFSSGKTVFQLISTTSKASTRQIFDSNITNSYMNFKDVMKLWPAGSLHKQELAMQSRPVAA